MKNLFFLFLFFVGMTLSACGGCGGDSSDSNGETTSSNTSNSTGEGEPSESGGGEASNDEPKNLAEAMDKAKKALEEAGLNNQAEVINFRDLQKHLPDNLADMERTSKGGQTSGAMGFKVSNAEAKYKTDDGATVEITLTDTGGLGMGLMSVAAWNTIEVDREDENGSERTFMLDGNKAFEKIDKQRNSCEISVISKGRYVTNANCRDCKMETLKKAIKEMDLDDLPEAKKE